MRTQERRFRQLLENMGTALVLMDMDGTTLHASPGFSDLLDRTERIAHWDEVPDHAMPSDRERLRTGFTAAREAPCDVEFRVGDEGDEPRWIRLHLFPIPNERGVVYRIGGLAEDITERRGASERLLETTRFLERIVTNISEAVLVIGGEGDFRTIVEVNRAAELIFGWDREEMIGSRTELLHASRERFHAFGRESQATLRRGMVHRATLPMRRRDGTVFEAHQTVALLDPEAGLNGGVVSVVRDISEQVQAERQLRESEQRFREIAEHVQDVFWIMAPDGHVEYVSPAFERIWGKSSSELFERPEAWLESVHPDDVEEVRAALPRQGEGTYAEEYRIVRPDGEIRWIWDRAFPVRDEEGVVRRILGVAGDVTERRTLERRLRQVQKMEAVGRLAGGVAHDFNNLLTVIVGQSDLLLIDLPEESEWAEEVTLIRDAAERGSELTRQLLAFSRDQVLRPRLVDVAAVLGSLEPLLERLLGDTVDLIMELSPDLPPVRVDRVQLEQVVMNLVANARDAMPRGGVVTVAVELEEIEAAQAVPLTGILAGEYVTVTVADTGEGMDRETRARIFEPFFSTRRDRGGTGLGLATSYGIVKQSGGTIHVESEPGQGATFAVRFPPADRDG
ncbi:MAG: PAS domain S-box protein [Gemmatimonadota bacterium]|nr:PAS domain S-box protein [Gemmatimonadota bacterium]